MRPDVMRQRNATVAVLAVLFLCFAAAASSAAAQSARNPEEDVAYYVERARALATEAPDEIGRTDFARLRRGRLYYRAPQAYDEDVLQDRLTAAFNNQDVRAVLDVTAQILVHDQADIRAHILRGFTLNRSEPGPAAAFHSAVGVALIGSIIDSGDGYTEATPMTVYRVKEEYEILKVLGAAPGKQSLVQKGERRFDVLAAADPKSDSTITLYFDITELWNHRARQIGAF